MTHFIFSDGSSLHVEVITSLSNLTGGATSFVVEQLRDPGNTDTNSLIKNNIKPIRYNLKDFTDFATANNLILYATCDQNTTVTVWTQQLGTPGSMASTSVASPVLTWAAVAGASKYIVQRDVVSTFDSGALKTFAPPVAALTFTDTTAALSTKYYYRVQAIANNSPASAQATPSTAYTPLLAASNLAATSVAHPVLTWTADPHGNQYTVKRSTNADMSGSSNLSTTATGGTYTDSTAAGTTTYYYTVTANTNASYPAGAASNIATATTP